MEKNQKTAAQQQSRTATPKDQKTKNADALRRSTLYPGKEGFAPTEPVAVGGVWLAQTPIEYNTGRKTLKIKVANTGDRPIQVGSHFHFFEVNRYLEFDRDATFGYHLNIPATTAVRFEPGDCKEVELVTFSGKRRIIGFNALVMGYAGDENDPGYTPARTQAQLRVRMAGFKTTSRDTAQAEKKTVEREEKK